MTAMGGDGLTPVKALVTVFREFRCLTDPDPRAQCLRLIDRSLGTATVKMRDHRVTDYFLAELAERCLDDGRTMAALRSALDLLAPGVPAMEQLDAVVEQVTARPALPPSATARLRGLLEGMEVAHLGRLARAAAGPLHDLPPFPGPWAAFEALARLNARSGGLPPGLALVERLAAQAPWEEGEALRAWADEQARGLSLTERLRELRRQVVHAAPAEPYDAYLVIRLLPQDQPGRYELSSWHSYDPEGWRPVRGEARKVTAATAERAVQELVYQAAEDWVDARRIHLEFVLASDDLNMPVHLWRLGLDSELATPLCLSYPVVVRSLERSRQSWLHWPWRMRWKAFASQPSQSRQAVVEGQDPDSSHPRDPSALLARLNADPHVTALVLSAPPGSTPEGTREALVALRAGIPAVVWDRRRSRDPGLVHDLRRNSADADGYVAGLREAVTQLRLEAHADLSPEGERHPGRHVVLVWDDPTRPVETQGRLTGPDQARG
ncbi:hypothetical protein RKE29_09580 [Streptomyces sp. B1866]|uniref:VMAP-C domain-containing protein n=1 Tax=Streptomyces sp. B1866 TaxID=3075431 RepID=UPI00288D606D|nr:hypothetical protein [Streptomyces sp. B1866]MDT3396892.1 hypothetical protein [Streptomyces sp. B1866]